MTSWTTLGLLYGLFLGIASAFGGVNEFLVVLVFGALGIFVGRVLDGAVDLSDYVGGGRDRSRS
jgi:cobalamin synthase